MKDKLISEKLNSYADALERKESILDGAKREMESESFKRRAFLKERRKRNIRKIAALSFAAVLVVTFGIIYLLREFSIGGDNSPPTVMSSYAFTDLARKVSTESELEKIEGVKLLKENEEGFELKSAFVYYDKKTDIIYAVAAKYKAIRNGFFEDVAIVSDLKGGLTDYSVPITTENEPVVKADVYINGEYLTDIYLKKDSMAYFIFIQSPITNASDVYIKIL